MEKLKEMQENVKFLKTHYRKFTFPRLLCRLREAICISRMTMAYDLEMDYSKLFDIENGFLTKAPDLATLKKIAS